MPDDVMIARRRYVAGMAADFDPALGITSPEWQCYDIEVPSGVQRARSMLTLCEIALLYATARHDYSGEGQIVDAGPLLGVGTCALAKGLLANPLVTDRNKRISTFDLWLAADMGHTVAGCGLETGSVFDRFLQLNRDYLELLSLSPGDVSRLHWRGGQSRSSFSIWPRPGT